MIEIKHFKVKVLPSNPEPNSIYFVVADGATAVTTYVTDVCGVSLPLVDLQGSGGSGGCCNLTGTGVTGTQQNPIVNISTFLSSENGNLITLSTIDGKLYLGDNNDNKVIYFYPTLEELGAVTLREVTETQIANWIQNQGIIIADDEIPLFKIKLDLFAFTMYEVGVTGFLPSMPIMKTFYATSGTNNNGNILVDVGANVYLDKQGSFPFYPEDENLKYVYQWGSPTSQCYYKIDSNSKITIRTCESIS